MQRGSDTKVAGSCTCARSDCAALTIESSEGGSVGVGNTSLERGGRSAESSTGNLSALVCVTQWHKPVGECDKGNIQRRVALTNPLASSPGLTHSWRGVKVYDPLWLWLRSTPALLNEPSVDRASQTGRGPGRRQRLFSSAMCSVRVSKGDYFGLFWRSVCNRWWWRRVCACWKTVILGGRGCCRGCNDWDKSL